MQKLLSVLHKLEEMSARQRERARERRRRPQSPFGAGYATFYERMIAATIDLLIIVTLTAPLMQPPVDGRSFILNCIWQSVVLVGYCLGWWYFYASTPGKMLLRLHIVSAETGAPMSHTQALRRVVAYAPSVGLVVGIFFMLWRNDRRMLHDLWAGTAVVKKAGSTAK